MTQFNQVPGAAIPGGDLPFTNYAVTDIAAGLAVKIDTANPGSPSQGIGVKLTTSDADAIGITVDPLPAGKSGRVRVYGVAVGTAGAACTLGDVVMTNAAGKVIPQTAGLAQIGRVLQTAVADDAVQVLIEKAKNS